MPAPHPTSSNRVLARGSFTEATRIAEILRKETVGGALLLLGSIVALVWINSPAGDAYTALREYHVGPAALHLDLSLGTWAADGLLAIFFFVVGLELKREFVAGDLRDPARAALPILAALGGVMVPAAIYLAVNVGTGGTALAGWAIPTATDIAFALAVLAIISSHLPTALRTFLLTLAVVDDLVAVSIIAVFFTDDLHLLPLAGALVPLALFALAVQRRIRSWWLLIPLAAATWVLVHESGVHATVAGVLLGLTVPVVRSAAAGGPDAGPGLAEHFEHRFRPISTGVAVPVFAFFAAGVQLGGLDGLSDALVDPVALGIVAGLVLGKPIGILGTAWLTARFTHARLDDDLAWLDVLGVSMLGGIGFTVSLLIGELAFETGTDTEDHVKVAILVGSLAAGGLAAVLVKSRDRAYERIGQAEKVDTDADGVPDVYQQWRTASSTAGSEHVWQGGMVRAAQLAERVPTVVRATTGAEAARVIAEYRLSGLVVADANGIPIAVIPGSQLLSLVLPQYLRDEPNLSHAFDERGADELCSVLNKATIAELVDAKKLTATKPPSVLPEDTLIEIASVMDSGHTPVVLVVDRDGGYHGVITLSRVLAAIAAAAGQDTALVRRRIEQDIVGAEDDA